MRIAAKSNKGLVRASNQDSYSAGELPGGVAWAVVCDGMGGANGGNIASVTAVRILSEHISASYREGMSSTSIKTMLSSAMYAANVSVFDMSRSVEALAGMGTTAVAAVISDGVAHIVHAGDSRAYIAGGGVFRQITKDHSYVQELVSRGEISPEMAKNHPKKNYITRAMGAEDTVKVDISIKPYNGETLVLCSDGLTNFVEDDEIRTYIKNKSNLQKSAEELVALANERGGGDNITIVALEREKCDNEQ